MESLIIIVVFFVAHLAVIFGLSLIVAGATSLLAIMGFGGKVMTGARLLGLIGTVGALATAVTMAIPLLFAEHLVQPYLDGVAAADGPRLTLEDASVNLPTGEMRADKLHLKQDRGAYHFDVRADEINAAVSPLAALSKTVQVRSVALKGVRGWLAPGAASGGTTAPPRPAGDGRPFEVRELAIEDTLLEWRPRPDAEPVGQIIVEEWRTQKIDHQHTLLDLLGHTAARGRIFGGTFSATSNATEDQPSATWDFRDMSLASIAQPLGGPLQLIDGLISVRVDLRWAQTLDTPISIVTVVDLADLAVRLPQTPSSLTGQLLNAVGQAVVESIPPEDRAIQFEFDLALEPATLEDARSISAIDLLAQLQDELRAVASRVLSR